MSAPEFVYRCEETRSRNGERRLIVWRRKVLEDSGDQFELGEVERAIVTAGTSPEWKTTGGLLGRACRITRERLKASGYTSTAPREVQQ